MSVLIYTPHVVGGATEAYGSRFVYVCMYVCMSVCLTVRPSVCLSAGFLVAH